MSNKQARSDKRYVLKKVYVEFEDGSTAQLDITKIKIIDNRTKQPLFRKVK